MRALVIIYDGKELSDKCVTKIMNVIASVAETTSISITSFDNKELAGRLLDKKSSKNEHKNKYIDEKTENAINYLCGLCGDPIKESFRFKTNLKLQANNIFIDRCENENFVNAIDILANNYEKKSHIEYMISRGISSDIILTIYQLYKLFKLVKNV